MSWLVSSLDLIHCCCFWFYWFWDSEQLKPQFNFCPVWKGHPGTFFLGISNDASNSLPPSFSIWWSLIPAQSLLKTTAAHPLPHDQVTCLKSSTVASWNMDYVLLHECLPSRPSFHVGQQAFPLQKYQAEVGAMVMESIAIFLDLESREICQAVPELSSGPMGVSGKDHTLYILMPLRSS